MRRRGLDHDALFKQLLTTFLAEFLELFAPALAAEVEPGSVEMLNTEVFHDFALGSRQVVDVLARLRLRGRPSAILVHGEPQASRQGHFAERMFTYFAFLWLKFRLPVHSIAVLSFDVPLKEQPDSFEITLPGLPLLSFHYRVVHLRRLDWRQFLGHPNPVAAALMSKMGFERSERPRVKLECLRMLAGLELDPARRRLVSVFIDNYLKLTPSEATLFDEGLARLSRPEQEKVMEFTTSWEQKGLKEGLRQGREEGREEGQRDGRITLLLRQVTHRLGPPARTSEARIRSLSTPALDELGEALLDFVSPAELTRWLAARRARTASRERTRPSRPARRKKS